MCVWVCCMWARVGFSVCVHVLSFGLLEPPYIHRFFAPILHLLCLGFSRCWFAYGLKSMRWCCRFFFRSLFPPQNSFLRWCPALLRRKTNVSSYLSTCLFQDSTHGFLLINLLFALSYFICHNYCFYFQCPCGPNCACLFQGIFSGHEDNLLLCFKYCFLLYFKSLWRLRLSLCNFIHSRQVFLFFFSSFYIISLLQHNESVRFSAFLHSLVEKPCSLRLGGCAAQAWIALTNRWPAVICAQLLCQA